MRARSPFVDLDPLDAADGLAVAHADLRELRAAGGGGGGAGSAVGARRAVAGGGAAAVWRGESRLSSSSLGRRATNATTSTTIVPTATTMRGVAAHARKPSFRSRGARRRPRSGRRREQLVEQRRRARGRRARPRRRPVSSAGPNGPVAIASTRTPSARAQAMSRGVSPISSVRSRGHGSPSPPGAPARDRRQLGARLVVGAEAALPAREEAADPRGAAASAARSARSCR